MWFFFSSFHYFFTLFILSSLFDHVVSRKVSSFSDSLLSFPFHSLFLFPLFRHSFMVSLSCSILLILSDSFISKKEKQDSDEHFQAFSVHFVIVCLVGLSFLLFIPSTDLTPLFLSFVKIYFKGNGETPLKMRIVEGEVSFDDSSSPATTPVIIKPSLYVGGNKTTGEGNSHKEKGKPARLLDILPSL